MGEGRQGPPGSSPQVIQYAGAIQQMQVGNGLAGGAGLVEAWTYNSRLQAAQIQVTAGGNPLWTEENFFCAGQTSGCTSNNGNVISQRLTAPKTGSGTLQLATTYGYDGVNRITTATEAVVGGATAWTQSYGYGGQFGNLTKGGDSVEPLGLSCSSYNGTTNRCNGAGFGYDAAGNATAFPGSRTAAYDAENRQRSLTDVGTSQYLYDGEGRRVEKVSGGQTTVYVYDGMGQLAAEYGAAGDAGGCTRCYATVDQLGSTRLVTDGTTGAVARRYDYIPYGGEINVSWGQRSTVTGYVMSDGVEPKFTGKTRDYESGLGLDYFGARYFSGAQGRFTTVDPTMESVVLSNPQTWNRYSYVLNNPLRFVDPDGELWVASGNSNDPYGWVDSCAKGQTCFTSVAADIGRDVRVYGSTNAQDISNYGSNASGMVDLNAVAGQHDAEFLVKGGSENSERFASADATAGFFNAARDYAADPRFAGDAKLMITAASLETGAGSAAHPASHGNPNSAIDFRYMGANGQPIQGKNAAAGGDPVRNAALFTLFSKAGFNQTVSGRPKDFGSGPRSGDPALIRAHQDHGHAGIKRIKPPSR